MPELLHGRISDTDGLKEVLEIVATFKDVNSSVLQIQSEGISGRIGIAWGRYITGASFETAQLNLNGRQALRRLLRLRSGVFQFVDLKGIPVPDLRQSLGVDLVRAVEVVPHLNFNESGFLYDLSEPADSADLFAPPAVSTNPHAQKPAITFLQMNEGQKVDEGQTTLVEPVEVMTVDDDTSLFQPSRDPSAPPPPTASRLRTMKVKSDPRITIFSAIFFVVSCALTVVFGPQLWQQLSKLFNLH